MKILTKEEEDAHYREVVKGGTIGGLIGLVGGAAGVLAATRRYQTIRNLTLPMKSFLVTSSGTFVGIISADHASRSFEAQRNASRQWYENREERLRQEELSQLSTLDRALQWARREKYKIVGATWVASMIGSFAMVNRNKHLSGSQKLVQARVYAQGLTLAVLVASAAFEIQDQRKGRGLLQDKVKAERQAAEERKNAEQEHTGDLWKDMVAAEEDRLRKRKMSLSESDYLHPHNGQEKKVEEVKEEKEEPKKEAAEAKEEKKE
ncbi:HIG1 domain-containing protein [Aspergillus luchuensis]|uniref:Mitochondrial hypoxia responsive domain protein n=6 Tax=Aspergillus subgen. Circumdati TaxID=2720871 RepID=A0A146FU29_ASPKA|nr:mitochondrial hypoxia responsive domain protein [Aspergillus neoniger CBS 115656]XP_025519110.1 mitochondrial hypoxia responsive domain protein [Aspergillus piperis CBS 112811]XP_025536768.1 mitochondrial hypoxia responsive domain protein [Aspergillus costaricaensis CBS 115574]XP_025557421.1 mitochondrial hypoxia responsive domain protein [Aspergillus vadensis CBS 113365]XP_041541006.1 uncharacterized protein AKAW2_30559S [Aspergillus luchuensis]OJZ88357.1 hypothetical protein ASPFODRAFT_44